MGQKSSFTNPNGASLEVSDVSGEFLMSSSILQFRPEISIKETLLPGRSIITDREKFTAFVKGIKAGEFDHFCTPEYQVVATGD